MWKIAVVMVVTAVFAGLLISDPYGTSSDSTDVPVKPASRPAKEAPPSAQAQAPQAETAPVLISGPVAEALATMLRPQDPQDSFPKTPADSHMPQDPGYTGSLGGQSGKPVTPAAPYAMPGSITLEPRPVEPRPVAPSADQTIVVPPVAPRREDPMFRLDVAFTVDGACTSGEVVGLDPNGDNFLSVRSGPGGQPYREIDRLFTSDSVQVCNRKGVWLAVQYAGRKVQGSCDLAPKGTLRANEGSCQYGWVHSHFIKMASKRFVEAPRNEAPRNK